MSERIDHAQVADRLLDEAGQMRQEQAALMLAAAQVQATLALVEQQRAANIIAVADATHVSSETARKVWAAIGPLLEVDLNFGADS